MTSPSSYADPIEVRPEARPPVRPEVFRSFDLLELGLLPDGWVEQVTELGKRSARHVQFDGDCSTTIDGQSAMEYDVVTGDVIREELPWLWEVYTTQLVSLATITTGQPMKPSVFPKSAININLLAGSNAHYEWHVDSNTLTGLLFACTFGPDDGGELAFRLDGEVSTIPPRTGELLIFDAREAPHAVLPMRRDLLRVSIPMNFYFLTEDEAANRPPDLDAYLYG
jgi:hypothetical protein